MKYFFLLLFFARTILLTPEPISIVEDWTRFTPEKSFKAIARGSKIRIRLTKDTKQLQVLRKNEKESKNEGSFWDPFDDLEEFFPANTIEAKLIWADGTIYNLSVCGHSISRDKTKQITADISLCGSLPIDVEFEAIDIRSNLKIENVELYWQNMGRL